MRFRRVLVAVTAAVAASLPSAASASVSGTTGAVVSGPTPASLADGAVTSNDAILVVEERSVTVSGPLAAALSSIYAWNGWAWTERPPATMRDLCVTSHLVHYDRASGRGGLTGTVRFAQPIVAILPIQPLLDLTDGPLGAPGTIYATREPTRGTELLLLLLGNDVLGRPQPDTLSINARTTTLPFVTDRLDEVRVLTACSAPVVPDFSLPVVLPLTGVAIAVAALALRRRRALTTA